MDGLILGTIGHLALARALDHPELLAAPVRSALSRVDAAEQVGVAQIDPALADTAAFCERYGVRPDESANCVIVAARGEGVTRLAACVVLATKASRPSVCRPNGRFWSTAPSPVIDRSQSGAVFAHPNSCSQGAYSPH